MSSQIYNRPRGQSTPIQTIQYCDTGNISLQSGGNLLKNKQQREATFTRR